MAVSARNALFYAYDEFQRISALASPGDTLDAPTHVFRYELGAPVSAVHVLSRSEAGGELDLEKVVCRDGRGRRVQTRTLVSDGEVFVDGFQELNERGNPVRIFQPYTATALDRRNPTHGGGAGDPVPLRRTRS